MVAFGVDAGQIKSQPDVVLKVWLMRRDQGKSKYSHRPAVTFAGMKGNYHCQIWLKVIS
jgi:hypothetical protein